MRTTDDPQQSSAHGTDSAHADEARDEHADPASTATPEGLDAERAWHAVVDFVRATGDLVLAMGGLLRSELSLAHAAWPRMLELVVVLVGLGLSLWLSTLALVAWGLYALTGSIGWALLALIVVQVIALWVARIALKRTAHHMSLPETRSEVRELLHRASHSS